MNHEKPFIWLVRLDYSDPATEAEWNDFYSSVHLDEMLALPGVERISRYECIGGRKANPKYMSITEITGKENLQHFLSSPEAIAVGKVLREKFPNTVPGTRAAYQHIITVEKRR